MSYKIITSVALGLSAFCASPAFAVPPHESPNAGVTLEADATTQDFVTKVAASDMFEIRSAHLALERARDPKVKAFAQRMIHDHGETTKQLKSLIEKTGIKVYVPAELDPAHEKKLEALQQLSGAAFDARYAQMQEQAHKDAIALFKNYASHGEQPNLQDWAGRTLPVLQSHLDGADHLSA